MGDVSRETLQKIDAYLAVLRFWDRRISLVGPGERAMSADLIAQVTQALDGVIPREKGQRWMDLGSGNGLPAIPLLIWRRELGDQLTLVEADGRKAAFLRAALREIGLIARVEPHRIEAMNPHQADIITVRALAPLRELFGLGMRHLTRDGKFYALKGANADAEIDIAMKVYHADIKTYGASDAGVIVEASRIHRR